MEIDVSKNNSGEKNLTKQELQDLVGTDELLALSSTKINEKITLNVYKDKKTQEVYVGVDHFHFRNAEVMFKLETFKSMIKLMEAQNLV